MDKKALSSLIGKNIGIWRRKRTLSQDQLAEKLGITKTHLAHVERGERTFGAYRIYAVANILGVSIDSLFYELEADHAHCQNILRLLANQPSEKAAGIEQILFLCSRLCNDGLVLQDETLEEDSFD